MRAWKVIAIGSMMTLGLAGSTWGAEPAKAPFPAQDGQWDMATFERIIQPMRHDVSKRLPLLLWNFPIPRGQKLVEMRADGSLRKAIDIMAPRGMVPTIDFGWEWTPEGAMALAETLRDAKRPVHLNLAGGIIGEEAELYAKSPKFTGPCPTDKDGKLTWTSTREWPCLPVYDVSKSVAFYKEWMKKFKDANVNVVGAWADYEALPYPWNFVYESQKLPGCAERYPAGALDSWQTFATYISVLRAKILKEGIVDPIHAVFPKALVADYGDVTSTPAYPNVGNYGNVMPPMTTEGLDADMPVVYALACFLSRYYNQDWPVTQADADNVFFTTLLVAASTSLGATPEGKLNIPYICQYMFDTPGSRYNLGMSDGPYRELCRHIWLRGADTLYLFNLGFPGGTVTPRQSFVSVENARSTLDELLDYGEFLDKGKPMNFDQPAMRTCGIVWSGLALPDKVLVRTFTFGPVSKTLDLIPFPGVAVKLEATNRGATYLIDRKGQVKQVRTGLM